MARRVRYKSLLQVRADTNKKLEGYLYKHICLEVLLEFKQVRHENVFPFNKHTHIKNSFSNKNVKSI